MSNTIIRKSLADEVAEKLTEQIRSGGYRRGEQLPIEPELMKNFGVGRSTIREAIKLMVNAGLLKVQQGVGTFVEETEAREHMDQRLKRARVEDLDEVRQLLEQKIAEKAALNRTDADIETIGASLALRKQAAEKGDVQACIQADIDFHVAIAQASGNDILADLYVAVSKRLKDWFIQIYCDTSVFEQTYPIHQQLFKHIVAGNGPKAWATAASIIGHQNR